MKVLPKLNRALQILVRIVQGSLWLMSLPTLVAVVGFYWPMRVSALFDLIFAAAPWVLIFTVPLCVAAFLLKQHYLRWALLAALVALGLPYGHLFVPRRVILSDGTLRLKVMTFNTWGEKRQEDAESIAMLIYQQQPDVVMLQEMQSERLWRLIAQLNRVDPKTRFYFAENKDTDQAILSRFPLKTTGMSKTVTQLLQVRVQTPAGEADVWNVHAYRENFLSVFSNQNILSYSHLSFHRDGLEQFSWLADQIDAVNRPLLVAGDFNVPPYSPEYTLLAKHLKNAFAEAGSGFGFTFPATRAQRFAMTLFGRKVNIAFPSPVAQIDHVFYSDQFRVTKSFVLVTSAGSDHRPVISEFILN